MLNDGDGGGRGDHDDDGGVADHHNERAKWICHLVLMIKPQTLQQSENKDAANSISFLVGK